MDDGRSVEGTKGHRRRRRCGDGIVIAGGGTGGHVYPALAIADALVAAGRPQGRIRFVGSARALEAEVVPAAGYEIALLPGRGIKRRLSLDNLGAVAGLVVAAARTVWAFWRHRPEAVVSVGGYASAPASLAAVLLRVPLVLAESNAVPGAANRLVARAAAASAVAWPGTPLPRAVVTGNPVRPEILAVDRSPGAREAAKVALGVPTDRVLVASIGGSLGSGTINRALADLATRWRDRDDAAVHHVVGRRDWDQRGLRADIGPDARLVYRAVPYEDRMAVVYAAADVMVCRAGATTAAELAAVGVPSVLVPLPGAPGDHQTANAKALAAEGGAVVLADRDCDGAALQRVLEPLLDDPARLEAMRRGAAPRGRNVAAERIAALVEGVIGRS